MSVGGQATREHGERTSQRLARRITVVVEHDGEETTEVRPVREKEPERPAAEHATVGDQAGQALLAVRGPLLAVCGLCGGAGTSTLAYLVALVAARDGSGPVLVGDTGGPGGGLSYYAGVSAPRSLVEAAEHVASGLPTGQLVTTAEEGLRVFATEPRFGPECARDRVELLVDHVRERYALSVIDCGTLAREADQVALAKASHVAWVVPATDGAVRRAARVLDAAGPYLLGAELIVARRGEGAAKAPLRELRRVAEDRQATLVLFPSVPDLATGQLERALELAKVSLQVIAGVVGW
jgi:Flp pilus assembly CpaE family ATPase